MSFKYRTCCLQIKDESYLKFPTCRLRIGDQCHLNTAPVAYG